MENVLNSYDMLFFDAVNLFRKHPHKNYEMYVDKRYNLQNTPQTGVITEIV